MSIYQPYFYIIQDVRNGMYYAGIQYSKKSDFKILLKENGYQTSSNVVKYIIQEHGLETFKIRKIKIFDEKLDAMDYETRFLRKVNASKNDRFYNMHNNTGKCDVKNITNKNLLLYGIENTFQRSDIKEKIKQTNLKKYGVEFTTQSDIIKEKIRENNLEKYGVKWASQTTENIQKVKNTCMLKYGSVTYLSSEEGREKNKNIMILKYGVDNYSKTPEYKTKCKKTNLEKYGVDNANKSDIIKEKIRENNLEKYGVTSTNKLEYVKTKKAEKTKELSSRPVVEKLRVYKNIFKFSIGIGWYRLSDEKLDIILLDCIEKYGEL